MPLINQRLRSKDATTEQGRASSVDHNNEFVIFISATVLNILVFMCMTLFQVPPMTQNFAAVSIFVAEAILSLFICKKLKVSKISRSVGVVICSLLTALSISGALSALVFNDAFFEKVETARKIAYIQHTSTEVLKTDQAKVYWSHDNEHIYTVSDMMGYKYINDQPVVEASGSEFYQLYNVGIQMHSDPDVLAEVFLYPPTPMTIAGYEYLYEYKYQGVMYVSRIFLPGIVDYGMNVSSSMFGIVYDKDPYYRVSKTNGHLIFQSKYSCFATPFANVKYGGVDEYFYSRYNKYLHAMARGEEYNKISEENVRFINSVNVVSATIKRVNFFWIGTVNDDGFTATAPVIEVVYVNDTSDIAIIRDIQANTIKTIIR